VARTDVTGRDVQGVRLRTRVDEDALAGGGVGVTVGLLLLDEEPVELVAEVVPEQDGRGDGLDDDRLAVQR